MCNSTFNSPKSGVLGDISVISIWCSFMYRKHLKSFMQKGVYIFLNYRSFNWSNEQKLIQKNEKHSKEKLIVRKFTNGETPNEAFLNEHITQVLCVYLEHIKSVSSKTPGACVIHFELYII